MCLRVQCVEVLRQLVLVSSLLLPYEAQWSNTGHHAWQQVFPHGATSPACFLYFYGHFPTVRAYLGWKKQGRKRGYSEFTDSLVTEGNQERSHCSGNRKIADSVKNLDLQCLHTNRCGGQLQQSQYQEWAGAYRWIPEAHWPTSVLSELPFQ